jgi:hypothetical protein
MCMGGDVGQCFFPKWQWICHWWSLKWRGLFAAAMVWAH